jgi:hypothetical protein
MVKAGRLRRWLGVTSLLAAVGAVLFVSEGCSSNANAGVVSGHSVDAWPYSTLQLGIMSGPGNAAAQRHEVPFGFRYQYLSGGVNTSQSWEGWGKDFVRSYITESEAAEMVPVFSYYEIRQSDPGVWESDEQDADLRNLSNRRTMRAYYENLKAFFQQAASATGAVVLQVEPDLWGYIEQRAKHQNASTVPAAVASSGMLDLRGMPNTAAGFAQAILVLRNNYAPHVIVAYHDSSWGTGFNIQSSHPDNAQVAEMAVRSVDFYRSLDAKFNAFFAETSDRDAGYAQIVNGEGTSLWWARPDFWHLQQYLAAVHKALHLPIVIWQIPVGNTLMRVMNNTSYHYQDNKVQNLLGSSATDAALLKGYARAGVAALLFGSGQPTDTCACDNDHNRLRDKPAPIDGNTRRSLSTDDDGGYLISVAAHYYHAGALALHR